MPQTKLTTHTERRGEKGLPKYDSQSETTIDSCPCQHIETQIIEIKGRKCPPKSHPDQTKKRHKKVSLRSGRDNSRYIFKYCTVSLLGYYSCSDITVTSSYCEYYSNSLCTSQRWAKIHQKVPCYK